MHDSIAWLGWTIALLLILFFSVCFCCILWRIALLNYIPPKLTKDSSTTQIVIHKHPDRRPLIPTAAQVVPLPPSSSSSVYKNNLYSYYPGPGRIGLYPHSAPAAASTGSDPEDNY
jgi:hypothetical protein